MSEAHRYQATWRNIVFNRIYDDTGVTDDPVHTVVAYSQSDYRLNSLDLTRVETVDYREQRQFLEGGEANEAYEGVMVAVGDGIILGSNHGDLADKTAALRAAFSVASVRRAALLTDPAGVLPLLFKRDTVAAPGYKALQIFARPASGRPVIVGRMREGLSRRFRFSLVAFDPKIYAQTAQAVAMATAASVTATNNGDLDSLPVFTVVCTAGATIKITIGGSSANSVTFTGVPAGTWTLDSRRSTITKADGTNGMQYRTAGFLSTLFLTPGSNTVDTTGSTNLTSGTVGFRDAYA